MSLTDKEKSDLYRQALDFGDERGMPIDESVKLLMEIQEKIEEITKKYVGQRLSKYDKAVLERWEDDEYCYQECLITPSSWMRQMKNEIEAYLREINLLFVISTDICVEDGISFTVTNKIYDEEAWYNSQVYTKTLKKKKGE